MKKKIQLTGFVLLILCGCSSLKEDIATGLKGFTNADIQIGLQFNDRNTCCLSTTGCDGVWDEEKQEVYMSALLVNEDGQGTVDQISISIENIDLKDISYPYVVSSERAENAVVAWYNEEEVAREKILCGDSGNACEYQGNLQKDKIELVLTSFEKNTLEGKFSGRIYLKGTSPLQFVKTSEFKDITEGSFRINLVKQMSESLADKK